MSETAGKGGPGALLRTYAPFPLRMHSARGCSVLTSTGEEYLDLYGGHCVCVAGHSHPRIAARVREQMERLAFYSTAGDIAIREEAAGRLIDFIGSGQASVFFVNSGAEANESALKAAVLLTGRKRFAYFEGSFHGRTLLALSVTDSASLRKAYAGLLAPGLRLPFNDLAALRAADFGDIAAAIVEPVQSMAGVREASVEWLQALRARCSDSGALLIFDEIQTGMGRLGAVTAAALHGVVPDMLTLAKGIANGYPCGALLMSRAVSSGIRPGDMGSTFGGGPTACAALVATLDVLIEEGLVSNAAQMGALLSAELPGAAVKAVRGRGLLLGLKAGSAAPALKKELLARRILVGGSDDPEVLRVMPPLCLNEAEALRLVDAVRKFGG